MIVTMMFAQACYPADPLLQRLHARRRRHRAEAGGAPAAFSPACRSTSAIPRSATTWRCCCSRSACSALSSSCARAFGRVLVAIRENEDRTRLLGYDTFRYKLLALAASGAMAGAAGAAYALLFAYVGATFASIEYSILPLLWVLLGGAGTVVGPFVGTLLMFYIVEFSSDYTSAYLLVVGVALVLLVLFFPKGIARHPARKIRAMAAVTLLEHAGPEPPVRRAQCRRQCRLRAAGRRDPRHHRAERRRQDDVGQHDLRPHRAFGAGGSRSTAPGHHAPARRGSASRAASPTPSRSPASSAISPASTMWRWRHSGSGIARRRICRRRASSESLDRDRA